LVHRKRDISSILVLYGRNETHLFRLLFLFSRATISLLLITTGASVYGYPFSEGYNPIYPTTYATGKGLSLQSSGPVEEVLLLLSFIYNNQSVLYALIALLFFYYRRDQALRVLLSSLRARALYLLCQLVALADLVTLFHLEQLA